MAGRIYFISGASEFLESDGGGEPLEKVNSAWAKLTRKYRKLRPRCCQQDSLAGKRDLLGEMIAGGGRN